MEGIGEYASIYWAAACLVFWAGRNCSNVSSGQFADAVAMVCDTAKLTLPQEALLKRIINKLTKDQNAR